MKTCFYVGFSFLEFGNEGFVVEPGGHVQDEEVPVLEAFVEDGFAVFGKVVFVKGAEAFVVSAK